MVKRKKQVSAEKNEAAEVTSPVKETQLALVESEEEEKKKQERLDQAKTGQIPDVRSFRLMYLEKCMQEAELRVIVVRKAYEDRIQGLKNEMNGHIREWDTKYKRTARKISDVRRELEDDYGISMQQWGYDDETGVLVRAVQAEEEPKAAPEEIDADSGGSKLTESSIQSTVSDRGSGAQ